MFRSSGPVRLTLLCRDGSVISVAVTPLAVAHGWITWVNIRVRAVTRSPLTV